MDEILRTPLVLAAIIAALVSLIGVFVSIISAKWQLRAALRKLDIDVESLRQAQLRDIMAKRMEAYPKLWCVLLTYGRNWVIEEKERNKEWAREFLTMLNQCNAEYGVFFSEPVYKSFHEYRTALANIERKLRNGDQVSQDELDLLEKIAAGYKGRSGLGTHLKDDLGSYQNTIFQLGRTTT